VDKNELLGVIYSLRAGLSAVACENDKIVELSESIFRSREALEQKYTSAKQDLDRKASALDASKLAFAKRKQMIRMEAKEKALKQKSGGRFSLFKKKKAPVSSPIEEAEAIIAQEESNLIACETELSRLKKELSDNRKKDELILEGKISDANSRIREISNAGYQLFSFLEKQYVPILYKSDWVHIDLILFYLESGRADSLKEALILLDQERQTKRIESAINESANRLKENFERSFKSLEKTVAYGFSQLQDTVSTGFANQNRLISQSMGDLKSTIENSSGRIEKRLTELCATESLNSSLLKKINTNSSALVSECNRLCSLTKATNEELTKIYTTVSYPD